MKNSYIITLLFAQIPIDIAIRIRKVSAECMFIAFLDIFLLAAHAHFKTFELHTFKNVSIRRITYNNDLLHLRHPGESVETATFQ